jgi:hypothetical protein
VCRRTGAATGGGAYLRLLPGRLSGDRTTEGQGEEATMGQLLRASCRCGYTATAGLGAGMLTPRNRHLAPARCRSCREVVTADVLAGYPTCGRCDGPLTFYGALQAPVPRVVGGGRPRFELTAPFVSPRCEAADLTFEVTALFD